jgi:methylase of polypeptide subunit release factors
MMSLRFPTVLNLKKGNEIELHYQFLSDDVRFSDSLVEYFLNQFTKEEDKIFDPFAGFGTTLFVAEKLNRTPFGIELVKDRYEFIKSNLNSKGNIILGDVIELNKYDFPLMDFSITSPPYMSHEEDDFALTSYTTKGKYEDYLSQMSYIYTKIKDIMKINSFIVIEVSNLKNTTVTTLAWDIAKIISKIFHFQGEIIISWEGERTEEGTYGYGYDHSYCLIFQNK